MLNKILGNIGKWLPNWILHVFLSRSQLHWDTLDFSLVNALHVLALPGVVVLEPIHTMVLN